MPFYISLFSVITEVNMRWLNTQKWKLSPSNLMTRILEGEAGSFFKHLTTECGWSNLLKKNLHSDLPGIVSSGDFKSAGFERFLFSSYIPLYWQKCCVWNCSPAWGGTKGHLCFLQLEKTHDTPPSSQDEGLLSCLAWRAKPSPLSRLHRRLDSL